MENNFYVGEVIHKRKIGSVYTEKIVLYTNDNVYYTNLISDSTYTTNSRENEYVDESSLIPTLCDEFKVDYNYLLIKHNSNNKVVNKKRRFLFKK